MGRTNPTYRRILRSLEDHWAAYRRALRHDDQPHFDRLFDHARDHADAAGYLNHDDPMTPVLLSIALEHERHLAHLETRIEALETRLDPDTDPAPTDH